jgi:hypothetical protein
MPGPSWRSKRRHRRRRQVPRRRSRISWHANRSGRGRRGRRDRNRRRHHRAEWGARRCALHRHSLRNAHSAVRRDLVLIEPARLKEIAGVDERMGAASGDEECDPCETARRHDPPQGAGSGSRCKAADRPAALGRAWAVAELMRIALRPGAVEKLAQSIHEADEHESYRDVSVELNFTLQTSFDDGEPFVRLGARG